MKTSEGIRDKGQGTRRRRRLPVVAVQAPQGERRAVLLVQLRRTIYGGTPDQLTSGTMMRVEGEVHPRSFGIEVSPIRQPGRRIAVSKDTEVSSIGPDPCWDARTMTLLLLARVAENTGNHVMQRALMRRYFAHHKRAGLLRMIASRDAQIVPYAGGAQ